VARLSVKVVPGASRNEIVGWMGETLKVRVSAPPERGRANEAVQELLAASLGVPASDVRIVSGGSSPRKIVEIDGLNDAAVRDRIPVRGVRL
jgi:uncharacterized protein (TIGR00251 family)